MNAPKLEARRIMVDGKIAVEFIVRNSMANIELHSAIEALGYKPVTDISNARSIVCNTPEEASAARDPIAKFF